MRVPEWSFNLPTVLVCGGSGFIGSHLVAKLSADGVRVIVPTRREARARHLIFLPRVEVVQADMGRDGVLGALLKETGADAVINLVGRLHSRPGTPYGPDFAAAHVALPRRIVDACAVAGVGRYLHMSALGAGADAPSMYLRSKADGELAALSVPSGPGPAVTIFRPSLVFGPGERLLTLFARLQQVLPLVPLAGADARFQPIYVEDVAHAFVAALRQPHSRGQSVELAGPRVYTLRQLVRLAGQYSGHRRPVLALPPALARLAAGLLEHAPGGPLMSRDNLASMQVDNVPHPASRALTAAALGIKLTPLEAVAHHYLGPGSSRLDMFRSRAGR
ncbi:MAG: complex I NDUFA9 subunit family protein [Pseudomonadota bacterium]